MSTGEDKQAHKIWLPRKTLEPGQHGKPRGKPRAKAKARWGRSRAVPRPSSTCIPTASHRESAARGLLRGSPCGPRPGDGSPGPMPGQRTPLSHPGAPTTRQAGSSAPQPQYSGSEARRRGAPRVSEIPSVQEAAPLARHRTPSSTFLSRSWGVAPSWIPYQHRIWGEAWGQLCLRRAGNRVSCQNRCWGLPCVVNHLTTR